MSYGEFLCISLGVIAWIWLMIMFIGPNDPNDLRDRIEALETQVAEQSR